MATRLEADVQGTLARLEQAVVKWWGFSLGTAVALGLGLSLGTLFLFVLVDALVNAPQPALVAFFGVWAALTLALTAAVLLGHRGGVRSPAAAARRVEMAFPEAGSHLINLVQFADHPDDGDEGFREAAMGQAVRAVAGLPFDRAAHGQTRWRRLRLRLNTPRDFLEAGCLLTAACLFGWLSASLLPTWPSSLARVLQPWRFVPAAGAVRIVHVTPGDAEVLIGSGLGIVAEVENPDGRPIEAATLHVAEEGGADKVVNMQGNAGQTEFSATLRSVTKPLRYRLEIGDSQTPYYSLKVQPRPSMASVEVTYHYPDYLGRGPETVAQKHGDLDAPQFTLADLTVHPLTPVATGHLLVNGERVPGHARDGGKTFKAWLLLRQPGTYTVHMFTESGQTDTQPRVNQVRVAPDAPPSVRFVRPAGEVTLTVGQSQPLVVQAADDHGLGGVRVEWQRDGASGDQPPEPAASWGSFADPAAALLHHELAFPADRFRPGDAVLVRAVAVDGRKLDVATGGIDLHLQPQEAATPWLRIRLISADERAKADLARLDDIRTALFAVLKQQVRARTDAAEAAGAKTADAVRPAARGLRRDQIAVQQGTVHIAESIGPGDGGERQAIKSAAVKLANDDMLQAVRQADALERAANPGDIGVSLQGLAGAQDRIIDALRRLLNEARRETADALAAKDRPETAMPPDVQDKLRGLRDRLKDFLDQQRKVIEASEDISRKAVEDFSDADAKKLEQLAGVEDDWSRFLQDKHSDFSKLPGQDFSNPSVAEELVAIETQLKMAKDALTKKAVDIAVPLEQLGAEMAEEMTTNIEKWLPDTPDRERWSQEEPLTDQMKEAPMAELPKELEDLVGDLMEDEEDLFDEMEDASSSWADSIDKGAGWDAMDGPISNMSARGVTGNRLPNDSEIGGRSGEGRQGKANGEMVGDTAVGKGGRKTPTRLSPDPFVQGQVKDTSKDPVGGATGGGKESGQGGEGLQGPVPNRPQREMQRLAEKQAELRNKAEAVDPKFQVRQYHHTDLKKVIDRMQGVETDLRAGRYQNALRQREAILEGLGQVRMNLEGEFAVRRDQSVNLPTDIQKEILGSMQEASPQGWEQLNRLYFERLGSGPAPARDATKPRE